LSRPVYITGYGVISAIGVNSEENFNSLSKGETGISRVDFIDTIHRDEIFVGEIKMSTDDLKSLAALNQVESNSRGTILSMIAAKEAISHAELSPEDLKNCALISGTSVGGMELFEQGYVSFKEGSISNPRKYFIEHDCGNINSKLATELGIKGHLSTISTACSSSANAILLGARLIKGGFVDVAIVGGSDALSKFTINGFKSLGILDENHSSPFDRNRKGLNLGEGAAYIVLESADRCKDKTVHAEIIGYGNANDAFHQTASSAEGIGAKLAMRQSLSMAEMESHHIDYINTHGTGTDNNDLSESISMQNIFGEDSVPRFNSFKPYTGHTLAACGAIEAVYSIFSLKNKILFPSLNFKEAIPDSGLTPIQHVLKNQPIHTVLSNSFGFGGNCTSLIFTSKI
jgi:3-oxoacyl-[acyl-carrier-protein] synthase-1